MAEIIAQCGFANLLSLGWNRPRVEGRAPRRDVSFNSSKSFASAKPLRPSKISRLPRPAPTHPKPLSAHHLPPGGFWREGIREVLCDWSERRLEIGYAEATSSGLRW
ncbi:MAG TPA: hypothetical protein VMD76_04440, partial [Candidatus Sulfotelmatobacter sp.]|nr:hypothetical protein [Candidatus Sulfotelmatobacter sp.]